MVVLLLHMAHLRDIVVDGLVVDIPTSSESNSAAEAGPWRRF
jgi:hypothetical protein